MDLIIVESPTKARTLGKFLGSGFQVAATMGHIRDLPEKSLGIKISDKNFDLEYTQTPKQKERTKELNAFAKEAKEILLASDPDREGEAIAWHVSKLLNGKKFKRVTFHEITEKAVQEALAKPGEINIPLVDAQQARRVIDRLVGYKLSPLLWAKVRKGLSAGRVQSVAVRLVCEKEEEIGKFKADEYWDIVVSLQSSANKQFDAKLSNKVINGEEAERVVGELRISKFEVSEVEKKDFRRSPPAPFTTSVLQQTAANKFGWTPKRTMQVAQSLYEQGFITYHRTDSTNIAEEALKMAHDLISRDYGRDYALDKPRLFKTKSKVAQEAHEAIRPTRVESIADILSLNHLNKDQERLFELIWRRFVASQMAEVLGETTKIFIKAGNYNLEAKGEVIKFDGWYKLDTGGANHDSPVLPELYEGEKLEFVDIESEQKFTQPPARFNEASLIKKLEELGIGRPSTYAPILATIQDRQYVEKVERRLAPTALGIAVNEFLTTNFAKVLDYNFTAKMEDSLDEIANGEREWQATVGEFWLPLSKNIDEVKQTAERVKVEVEKTGDKCPKCNDGDVIIRIGKFGRFLACEKFPECDYKANFVNKVGVKCTKCTDGDVILRKTRSGKTFYGCSNYPKCDFASWTKPK